MSSKENIDQQSDEISNSEEKLDSEYAENSKLFVEPIEQRCYWCSKAPPEIKELTEGRYQKRNQEEIEIFLSCTQEHENRTIKFLNFAEKFYFIYVMFMFALPVVLLAIAFIIPQYIFAFGFSIFISLGLGLVIMPLLGNQLVRNIGLKRSNLLGRVLGVILIILGVILILTFGLAYFQ